MGVHNRNVVVRNGLLRLVLFFVVLALAYGGPQYLLQFQILPHIARELRGLTALGADLVICVFAISIYALLVGWLERRDITELAIKRGLPLLGIGFGLAVLMFTAGYAGLFAMKVATWRGLGTTHWLLSMAAMAIISGVCEELMFRGGIYRITEDMFGTGVALIFSGALFGLMHLANPHATLLAGFAIAVEAGILLGAAYAASRNLWLPIGLHIGWNFSEGGIFGAAVSGGMGGRGLFDIPLSGPAWLSGGAFGPEASVVILAVCTAAGLYFVWRTWKSGRWCRAGLRLMLD
jgi:membrane protease YdiL (CAAX protease family)